MSPSIKFVELALLTAAEQEYQHQGGAVPEEGDCCPVCLCVHNPDTRGVDAGREDDDDTTPPLPPPEPPRLSRTSPSPPATKPGQLLATEPTPGVICAPTAGRNDAAGTAAGVEWYQLHCHKSHWVCGECFDEWKRHHGGLVTCPMCRHPVASYTHSRSGGRMSDSAAHATGLAF